MPAVTPNQPGAVGLVGQKLSFRYNRRGPWLLENLSLALKPGESVGLSGPSGAGKSTLAQILAGFIKPVSGAVFFNGQPLPRRGFCPVQYIYQHPQLAVNPRWRAGRIIREAWEPTEELLGKLEISSSWFNRYPHELSGGELQRLAVARALSPRARCLIADELSAMLDPLTQAVIWKTLLEFQARKGLSLLVISHDKALLSRVCQRVITL